LEESRFLVDSAVNFPIEKFHGNSYFELKAIISSEIFLPSHNFDFLDDANKYNCSHLMFDRLTGAISG
jgi:hypothetical protein